MGSLCPTVPLGGRPTCLLVVSLRTGLMPPISPHLKRGRVPGLHPHTGRAWSQMNSEFIYMCVLFVMKMIPFGGFYWGVCPKQEYMGLAEVARCINAPLSRLGSSQAWARRGCCRSLKLCHLLHLSGDQNWRACGRQAWAFFFFFLQCSRIRLKMSLW